MRKQITITLESIDGDPGHKFETLIQTVCLRIDACNGNPFRLRVGDTLTLLLPEGAPRDPNSRHLTADVQA